MSKVKILPEKIIAKIAAGEVIERPASVVKELLENSIDAGATDIQITLKDGGKTLIQIKDNGHGIDKDDLENIFYRHATSKISSEEDLFNIHSLGFRGEALYSVAAISDVQLSSKTKEDDSGWTVHMRGGDKKSLKPCPFTDHGTEITIGELFFNTPARRKFLKNNAAEFNQTLSVIIPYMLLYPNISFQLKHQNKEIFDLKITENKQERIAQVLNIEEKHLIFVEKTIEEKGWKIKATLGDINLKRPRRTTQYMFVNDRPVQNKNFSFHMNEVYRVILPPGLFPVFVLEVDVSPGDVDANIHPTKREVKIKDENEVCRYLRRIVEQTLLNQTPLQQVKDLSSKKDLPSLVPPPRGLNTNDFNEPSEIKENSSTYQSNSSTRFSYPDTEQPRRSFDEKKSEFNYQLFSSDNSSDEKTSKNLENKLKNARYIGAFIHKFQIFESESSLLFIDQHAAAERITYEKLIIQMEKGNVEIQQLLAPVTIKLNLEELNLWAESKENISSLGFHHDQWDDNTIAVHSHPVLIKDVEQAVRKILTEGSISKNDHDTIARRACRSSIMTGDKLSQEQAEYQKQELLQCLDPLTCPHGRPTVIEMNEDFLDKQFLRT